MIRQVAKTDVPVACVNGMLTQDRGDVRFFFFLPAPTGPLTGAVSCGLGAEEGAFGVGGLWAEGTGVGAGWADAVARADAECRSRGWERDEAMLECIAVVIIAYIMSELFWCFFGPLALCFSGASMAESSMCRASRSGFFWAASGEDESIMGHTKPERGV